MHAITKIACMPAIPLRHTVQPPQCDVTQLPRLLSVAHPQVPCYWTPSAQWCLLRPTPSPQHLRWQQ
jgi:hypothetical protein